MLVCGLCLSPAAAVCSCALTAAGCIHASNTCRFRRCYMCLLVNVVGLCCVVCFRFVFRRTLFALECDSWMSGVVVAGVGVRNGVVCRGDAMMTANWSC